MKHLNVVESWMAPLGFLSDLTRWLSDRPWIGWGLVGISLGTLAAAIVVLPWVVVRIPTDYFSHRRPPQPKWQQLHPGLRVAAILAKNLLGGVLLAAGFIMLFVPGQGLLCMLLGLALLDVPGKRALERWIVARPTVFQSLNKLRSRYGYPPLEHPYGG